MIAAARQKECDTPPLEVSPLGRSWEVMRLLSRKPNDIHYIDCKMLAVKRKNRSLKTQR
jgi:hypothetical protein